MRYQGKIIKWNDEKGFGFVVPKGGNQPVFVHVRAFSNRQRRPVVLVQEGHIPHHVKVFAIGIPA